MAICKTEGIILKKDEFRETSLIVRFFSRDYGKISCIFKGVRKDPKKFASSLEPISLNEIIFYKNNKSDLNLASQCDLLNNYDRLRQDLKKIYAVGSMLALIDSIMQPQEENVQIFSLLKDCLTIMNNEPDHEKVLFIFKLKMLSLSGFQPRIDSCVGCNSQVDYASVAYFSSSRGGLLCPKCRSVDKTSKKVYRGTIASLAYIQNNDINNNLRLGWNILIKKELSSLLDKFLLYHLEK